MKKFITFMVCVILLIVVVRMVALHYEEKQGAFAKIQQWMEPWKEKVEDVTDDLSQQLSEQFSGQIPVQDWELEGSYDMDTAGWFETGEEVLSGSQEYEQLSSGQVNSLTLRAAGCRVEIIESEEPDFYVAFENMKKVQAYQEEDSIILKALRDTELNQESESSVLVLYVPADSYLANIEIELGAGSMNIDVLQVQTLELSVEAGKLTVDSLQAETLAATLGAGMVSLKNVDLQNAKLSVGAGSMVVDGQIHGNVDAGCTVGNLELDLQGNVTDFNYEVQCVAGNIQIDEEKYSGINEEKRIDNAAEKSMKLDCAMGNIVIGF